MWRRLAGLVCAVGLAATALPLAAAGFPAAYGPVVVQPEGAPERAEFDLTPARDRARREHKRLYVYLGASDCRYCRAYEAFLERHVEALRPHFAASYVIVDLRSALTTPAAQVFLRVDSQRRSYAEFQRAIGDERARLLVYPTVWLLDAELRPLMQMPSGAGTFQTVPEQIEVLQLVQ